MTEASRGVTCGMVSICTERSITAAAMSADSRARAIGLSLMSTTCTASEAWSRAATPSIASMFVPLGGSSSTETTHSPASSRSCSSVRPERRAGSGDDLALDHEERHARLAALLDRGSDRGDLRRRRSAAAADQPRALAARLGGELGEVVGSRVSGRRCARQMRLGGRRSAARSAAGRWRCSDISPRAARAAWGPRPQFAPTADDPERAGGARPPRARGRPPASGRPRRR